MRRVGFALVLLGLTGCPGDDSSGATDGDTDTDTDTDATMTMTATSPSTTMNMSTSTTMDPSTTEAPTTDAPTTDAPTTDAPTTDAPTSGTSGGDAACDDCIAENCGDEGAACLGNPACVCWIDCLGDGGDNKSCVLECEGPPDELFDLFACTDRECGAECDDDDPTGGNGDGDYEPCNDDMPCPGELECNMFVNYCSINCEETMCPDPPGGDAEPTCSEFSGNCILPCDDETMCPAGMSCQNVGGPMMLCAFDEGM